MTTPDLHEHETRISLIEQNCEKCPDAFKIIFTKLDEIQKSITALEVENARQTGLRSLIWGTAGGGGIFAAFKALGYLFTTKQGG